MLLAVVPGFAAAQDAGTVGAIRPHYDRIKSLYVRSAEVMPEAKYGFRPTAGVRTYGELIGHVANES